MNIKRILIILFMCFDVLSIFVLAILFYLLQPVKSNSVVFIPQGSNAKIITSLNNTKLQFSKIDQYLLLFFGHPQSGWIAVSKPILTRYEFLKELTTNKAALVNLTLIPGETSEYFLREIAAKKLNLNPDKLLDELYSQSNRKEGMLTPDTYSIPLGISERLFIKYLLEFTKKRNETISKKVFGDYTEYKFYRFIIVASIIQKEAANESEMPIVASVIYNRLNKGMKLQMDGMLNYGMNSHIKVTPQMIREDNSEFNSYKNSGLPSVSICNVSTQAILAAISPAKTNYLYFMRDKRTGTHRFNTTLAAHEKEIERQR
ncbi:MULTISPECIES: endolytic transglycosylase MltG [unclassified Campylobacter]|uniref:endolytic transglycosylase MltG n=2 Tax=Campylobacter TaxID=194 RepID=UPI001BD9D7BD|nr:MULTISPECIES: endolytic transglycosylase MltG [unclassified Campylobacter]MBZ7976850.1 endolytic transglycosylase MltG [Campylobacter sp. RM12637]MBZ7980283.1 endolytic transglycosylase MltG [Campylobacter sp. RM12642]MBZ7982432.1 endolytic transglycosylase MltG [Campylobacter sp. RM12640]MBZ7984284.1 endolytic transglycosylase MltG [Campylobacter sp. RM12647]MBZ7989614.1 endolytic transglycosylase MltG [Campylobacter sp. RM12635]MBZ7991854.1 endolytic transglycosylase MltG [Campylobacter 